MRPATAPAILALLAVVTPADIHGKKESTEFRYELAVERVELDVLVHNAEGRFVTGLTRADFEVLEEGKAIKIDDFELRSLVAGGVDLESRPDTESPDGGVLPAPAAGGRKFIVFVDLLNTGAGAINSLKPALKSFASEMLREGDQLMLSGVTPNRRGVIVQEFTASRPQMLRAIDALRGNTEIDERDERQESDLYNVLYQEKRTSDNRATQTIILARMFSDIRQGTSVAKNFSVEELTRTSFALDALASLVEYVDQSQERGRKPVLFISERVPLRPAQGLYDIVNRRIEEYNRMLQAPGAADLNSQLFFETVEDDLTQVIRTTSGRLGRFGATVYGIDVRDNLEATSGEASMGNDRPRLEGQKEARLEGQQGLHELSVETGGVAYLRRNDFPAVFRDIERDNRARYFLTYKPPKHKKKDAKFYRVEVRCKQPGLTVRARKGYLD